MRYRNSIFETNIDFRRNEFWLGYVILKYMLKVTTQVVRQCQALKNRHFSEKIMFLAKN